MGSHNRTNRLVYGRNGISKKKNCHRCGKPLTELPYYNGGSTHNQKSYHIKCAKEVNLL